MYLIQIQRHKLKFFASDKLQSYTHYKYQADKFATLDEANKAAIYVRKFAAGRVTIEKV